MQRRPSPLHPICRRSATGETERVVQSSGRVVRADDRVALATFPALHLRWKPNQEHLVGHDRHINDAGRVALSTADQQRVHLVSPHVAQRQDRAVTFAAHQAGAERFRSCSISSDTRSHALTPLSSPFFPRLWTIDRAIDCALGPYHFKNTLA